MVADSVVPFVALLKTTQLVSTFHGYWTIEK